MAKDIAARDAGANVGTDWCCACADDASTCTAVTAEVTESACTAVAATASRWFVVADVERTGDFSAEDLDPWCLDILVLNVNGWG